MAKKELSALDDLMGESKKAPTRQEKLLDELAALLGEDRKVDGTKKRKLLSEIDALLSGIDAEESDEPQEIILLDLAPCQGLGLMHNGTNYLHGGRYTVSRSVANDLREMMYRGLSHEASITKSENKARRRTNLDANTPMAIRNPATGAVQMF